eukprot:3560644-Alexandrium_andersonii.AAC.1
MSNKWRQMRPAQCWSQCLPPNAFRGRLCHGIAAAIAAAIPDKACRGTCSAASTGANFIRAWRMPCHCCRILRADRRWAGAI